MSNTLIEFRISPSMHPANADKFSDTHVVKNAYETGYRTLAEVHAEKDRISEDSKLSLEGQQGAIQRFADSRQTGVMKNFSAAITYLEKSSLALKERLQNTLIKDDEMGAEIRAHYKSTKE